MQGTPFGKGEFKLCQLRKKFSIIKWVVFICPIHLAESISQGYPVLLSYLFSLPNRQIAKRSGPVSPTTSAVLHLRLHSSTTFVVSPHCTAGMPFAIGIPLGGTLRVTSYWAQRSEVEIWSDGFRRQFQSPILISHSRNQQYILRWVFAAWIGSRVFCCSLVHSKAGLLIAWSLFVAFGPGVLVLGWIDFHGIGTSFSFHEFNISLEKYNPHPVY